MIVYPRCFNIEIWGDSFAGTWWMGKYFPITGGAYWQALYESWMVAFLDMVLARRTGWAVIQALYTTGRSKGKKLRIVPYSAADLAAMGYDNAYAAPDDWVSARPKGPVHYVGLFDDPRTPEDERYRTVVMPGSGEGSNSTLHYSPWGHDSALPVCAATAGATACRPDHGPLDLFLHEMVHGLRQMRGQLESIPTRVPGYANEEEYFAILVTNIFMSECGKTVLRGEYNRTGVLSGAVATSEGFLGKGVTPSLEQHQNRWLVNKLLTQDYDLCINLSQSNTAAFNPIREYLAHPGDYPLTS
jgi:hypothetical protein